MRSQAEASFEALLESIDDLVWSLDRQWKLVAFNSAFSRYVFLTHHQEPVAGDSILDLLPPDSARLWMSRYQRAIDEGPYQADVLMMAGTTARVSLRPILQDESCIGVSACARDVTQQRINEQFHSHLAAAIECSEDIYITITSQELIYSWNQAAERIFGYRSEEAIGRHLSLLTPPEDQAFFRQVVSDVLAGHALQPLPCFALRRDNRRVQLNISAWPIRNPQGEVTAASFVGRDLSDRQEAEQAKALLVSIVEESADGICSYSPDGTVLSWNSGSERLLGYSQAEMIGNSIWRVAPANRIAEVRQKVQQLLKGEAQASYDAVLQHKNGQPVDASITLSGIRDATGAVVRISVIARDISQSKRLERALTEAESKYRALFDGALEGMYQTSISGRILTINRSAARMLGYGSVEEMKATVQNIRTNIWTDAGERSRYIRAVLASQGPILGFECRFRCKNGSAIWVSLNGRIVRDANGRPRYHEGFVEDITARLNASKDLAESESRFRSLFESARSVQLLLEPEMGEIIDANRAAAEYYGYPVEQLVGANITLLNILPHDEIKLERACALREERSYFNFCHRLASGELRDVQVYSSPVDVDGRILLYSNIFDVTEKNRAEKVLHETIESLAESQRIGGLGSYQLDIQTGVWTSSTILDEIFGIGAEYPHDLDGWSGLIHPEDRPAMTDYFYNDVAGKGTPFNREYRIVRPLDGEERWVHGLGRLDFGPDGHPIRMSGVIKDTTEQKRSELALRSSEERYRTVFQASIDTVLLTRMSDGVVVDVNNAFTEVTGYSRDEVIGRDSDTLGFWANPDDHQKVRADLFALGQCRNYPSQFRRRDGSLIWGLMSVSLLEVDGAACALSITRDITKAKQDEQKLVQAQTALRTSEERYRTVFQASMDGIAIARLNNSQFIDVNRAFLDLLGYSPSEVLGRTSQEIDLWLDNSLRETMGQMLRERGSFRDTRTRFRKRTGELLWVMLSCSLIEIEGEACSLLMIRDVSDAKAAEDKIWNLAFYDPLTRLPNRRLLMDRLRQSLVGAKRSHTRRAVLFIDLDNFKNLNDTLGHQNGDELLCEVARRLVNCVRESDTVARLGGDEFVVLLSNLDEQHERAASQAEAIAEKILAAIEHPYHFDQREYISTSSIGITVFDGHSDSTNDILQQADIAMYQAKASGRNTLRFFAPALQTAVQARAALEDEMRTALRLKQFELHYQPQFSYQQLIGAEALLRWNHPQRGFLLPGAFITLAEESGLIVPIGDWVLATACEQMSRWSSAVPPFRLPVSVNISARQFRQPGFVQQVLRTLEQTAIPPATLTLELTESMLIDNTDESIDKMNELRSHGVRFSLDDFGTGYSSLSYLKRLPFDQLKIDRSFVRDLLDDVGSQAIARSIISLGRALGLKVIAEGIESQEQRDLLLDLGCNCFQGHFFGRPQPLAEFESRWHHASHALTGSQIPLTPRV